MRDPVCIHVDTLKEGQPAQIYWEDISDVEGYQIERRIASSLQELPDQYQIVHANAREELNLSHPALAWRDIDQKAATWSEIRGERLTWVAFAHKMGVVDHVGYIDEIPLGMRYVQYRVKAPGSGYIYSAVTPIRSGILTHESTALSLQKDDVVYVPISAGSVGAFSEHYAIRYNALELELIDIVDGIGTAVAMEPGRANLQVGCEVPDGKVWSGLLSLLKFRARSAGDTLLTLTQIFPELDTDN